MKRVSDSHRFFHLFTNSTPRHLSEYKLIPCSMLQHAYVDRIYSLIAQSLKFDWSAQVTRGVGRLSNQIGLSKHKYSLVRQHQI